MVEKAFFVGPLERVVYLRSLPGLSTLTPAQLAAVAQHAQEKLFPQGSAVLRSDAPVRAAYLIVEGKVKVHTPGRESRVVGPGEVVGFLHLLARSEKGVEARAEVPTLALELDWDAQLDVCEEHFPVLYQYLRYLCLQAVQELRSISAEPRPSPVGMSVADLDRPLNLVERVFALREAPLFAPCSPDALFELARHVIEERREPGTVIWKKGAPADDFIVLVSGDVRCEAEGDGAFRVGGIVELGIHEALAGRRRWFRAEADTELRTLRVDIEPFVDILEDHFDMAIAFTTVMARRLISQVVHATGFQEAGTR